MSVGDIIYNAIADRLEAQIKATQAHKEYKDVDNFTKGYFAGIKASARIIKILLTDED